jgi:predicted Rossmann fold nucleotide-binding protein DprA/Smf involved in DNA uptake
MTQERRELAYWLTLAFRLERVPRRSINGLVLTADRRAGLGLLDLVRMEPEVRPSVLARYAATLDQLVAAEGKVSAQAFLVERILSMGAHVVPITDRAYPPHVAQRLQPERAPTVLTAMGNLELWSRPGVAISGSRKAGPSGLAFAREAGRAVARAGEVVVCGLAPGIDQQALEGALEVGGRVVGIAPEGLFHSRWVRHPGVRGGRLLVVSEFAPDDRWTVGRAMGRNRTIAGFSHALVIADCVASGGTTDQLEVHRAAGLPVYVRRGPGQGALVGELCRQRGVTPWDWSVGAVAWPPSEDQRVAFDVSPRPSCEVSLTEGGVSIRVDAPWQTDIDVLLASVRAAYERAVRGGAAVYSMNEDAAAPLSTAMEAVTTYGEPSSDPVLDAVVAAGDEGITARELGERMGWTKGRIQKRLRALQDANRIAQGQRRHAYVSVPVEQTAGTRAPAVGPADEEGQSSLF